MARPGSEVCEVYELCLERGWAYCAGRWPRPMPSGVLLWRRSGGWRGVEGLVLLYEPSGERSGGGGCGGYWRTIVMARAAVGPGQRGYCVCSTCGFGRVDGPGTGWCLCLHLCLCLCLRLRLRLCLCLCLHGIVARLLQLSCLARRGRGASGPRVPVLAHEPTEKPDRWWRSCRYGGRVRRVRACGEDAEGLQCKGSSCCGRSRWPWPMLECAAVLRLAS